MANAARSLAPFLGFAWHALRMCKYRDRSAQMGRSLRSPLKTPCEKLAPLKNAARIRFAQERAFMTPTWR